MIKQNNKMPSAEVLLFPKADILTASDPFEGEEDVFSENKA